MGGGGGAQGSVGYSEEGGGGDDNGVYLFSTMSIYLIVCEEHVADG